MAKLAPFVLLLLSAPSLADDAYRVYVTGGENAGGALTSTLKDSTGTSLGSSNFSTSAATSFGLELRFDRPSYFFFSGILEYSQLQVSTSTVSNTLLVGSGMVGIQGQGTIRPWAAATLGVSSIFLGRTSVSSGGYTATYQNGALGVAISPRVGVDWLVSRNIAVGAYAAYVLGSMDIPGTITQTSTGQSADFTETDSARWFAAGIRVGFSFGGGAPALSRTIASTDKPVEAPEEAPAPAPNKASPEVAEKTKARLKELRDLHESGAITDEEFEQKRRKILDEL